MRSTCNERRLAAVLVICLSLATPVVAEEVATDPATSSALERWAAERERAMAAEEQAEARARAAAKSARAKAARAHAHAVAERRRAAAQAEAERKALAAKPGVRIGMSADEVINHSSWGKPRSVRKTTTASGTQEQWHYGGPNFLYFDDGKLSTIQN